MKIHFIAIGGSIMHQLALVLQRQGNTVSGSDDEIFEPAYSNLRQAGLLPRETGWFAERITPDIDAVILGMHAKRDNPELLKAQTLSIPIYSFPQYVYEIAKQKKRVVIGGSHGKTTTTAMVMHVLKQCYPEPFDYLVGAKIAHFDTAVQLSADAPLIVLEGDEYLSSPLHPAPKFHAYRPQIALLTGIAWDHINVFPTFELYLAQFRLFIDTLPQGATLIYNAEDDHLRTLAADAPTHLHLVPYATPIYGNDEATNTPYLVWGENGQRAYVHVFGAHNMQNMWGAKLICNALGIADADFFVAIANFSGAARRLELVGQNALTAVYKDFAHAPSKVKATTEAMKTRYPSRRLIACLELHTYSSLNQNFLPQYRHSLNAAEQAAVYFDAHTFEIKRLPPLDVAAVQAAFDHPNLRILQSAEEVEAYVKQQNYDHTNLLLMSSGNFGGADIANIVNGSIL